MKAILEFPAPESCAECRLTVMQDCVALSIPKFIVGYTQERAQFCPLKIVEEEEEGVRRN